MSDIIEAAARALREIEDNPNDVPIWGGGYCFTAERVLAAVTPLIEDAYARKLNAAGEIARKGNEYVKGWKLIEDDGSVTTLGAGDDIIEAAARALADYQVDDERWIVRDILAAVTPLIRAAALEEAAALIETYGEDYPSEGDWLMRGDVAAKLRAMKEQP